jgi:hypothetical protein
VIRAGLQLARRQSNLARKVSRGVRSLRAEARKAGCPIAPAAWRPRPEIPKAGFNQDYARFLVMPGSSAVAKMVLAR